MVHAVLLVLLFQTAGPSASPEDFRDALAHAEALYYEAQFKDSIQLLLRIDDQLRGSSGFIAERATTKLQLALCYIGINDMDKANAFLRELYDISPDYALDAQQYSPKVVALAADAKKEEDEIRCHLAIDDARKLLQAGSAGTVVDHIESMKSKCADLASLEPDAADLLYKRGLDEYKRGDFGIALKDFRTASKVYPQHELASEYAALAEGKLQVTADKLFLEWRQHFEARQFPEAALNYHEIGGIANTQVVDQIQTAYRQALSNLVQDWNRVCPTGNAAELQTIRNQIDQLIPDPAFGADLRAQMSDCKKTGCTTQSSTLVMTRIKTQVNPTFSHDLRKLMGDSSQIVNVKLRIDEAGNVTVNDVQGAIPKVNEAVRFAMEHWKFAPAKDEYGTRCVDTEIAVSIR